MRWLLFLSRLAFICGTCFLLSVSVLMQDWLRDENLKSMVITIGYLMGIIVIPLINLCYLFVLLIRRKLKAYVPLWLILANLFFLLALLFFIFYLNDPYYHQP